MVILLTLGKSRLVVIVLTLSNSILIVVLLTLSKSRLCSFHSFLYYLKKCKNFFIIIYISCKINLYFKISSMKTNKNQMIPCFETTQNQLKKSHGQDFFNLPCSHYKLSQTGLFIIINSVLCRQEQTNFLFFTLLTKLPQEKLDA